ncbi:MAG: peptide ABC transporter permease [Chloroflexi bacterium]|nr:MAG: peptide ABC transporter permease [Chloroflexota bacterium]
MIKQLWAHFEGRIGMIIIIGLAVFLLLGPLISQNPDDTDYSAMLAAPSSTHLLGTDMAGRDLFARAIAGGTTSLGAALLVFVITSIIGLIAGVLAATIGGVVDVLICRLIDIMLGLPSQVLALAIVGLLGPSFANLVLAMSITGWASLARLARTCSLGSSNEPFVMAARMAGVREWRILLEHIVPIAWSRVLVMATLHIGSTILVLSGLSFLGLGAQPPAAEWGNMLSQARDTAAYAPWQLVGPGVGLFLSIAAANLIADALRDITGVQSDVF